MIVLEVDWDVSDNQCSVVIVLIRQLFTGFKLKFLVFNPIVAELLLERLNLGMVCNLNISESVHLPIDAFVKRYILDLNTLNGTEF